MGWVYTGNQGQLGDKTPGTTFTGWGFDLNTAVGDVAVILVGFDNTQTTDGGQSNEVLSVSDGTANIYTKIGEYVNGNGSAGAGAGVAIFVSTHRVSVTGTGTITFANSITAKGVTQKTFRHDRINAVAPAVASIGSGSDIAAPGSLDLTVPSAEYLWVRVIAWETDWFGGSTVAPTVTSGFSEFLPGTTSGGADDSNIAAWGEFRIFTGASNPSNPGGVNNLWDTASLYVALSPAPLTQAYATHRPRPFAPGIGR